MSYTFPVPVDVTIVDDNHVTLVWQSPVLRDNHESEVGAPVVYAAFWKDQDNPVWLHFTSVSVVLDTRAMAKEISKIS